MLNDCNILETVGEGCKIHWAEGQSWVTVTDKYGNKLGFQGVSGERWPAHYIRSANDFHNLASFISELIGLKAVQVKSERRGQHSFRFE